MSPDRFSAPLPPSAFAKEDGQDDAIFYAQPRFSTHIDDQAINALTDYYRCTLPAGVEVLDLMSSWVSHLPDDRAFPAVIGHGMNAEELAANPRLTRWFVQDLNQNAALPLLSGAVGAAMMCVGIQYLVRPVAVLTDLRRVLRPGSPLIISFSNRCFPTKAVAVWLGLGHHEHALLVARYLTEAAFSDIQTHRLRNERGGDPLTAVIARA